MTETFKRTLCIQLALGTNKIEFPFSFYGKTASISIAGMTFWQTADEIDENYRPVPKLIALKFGDNFPRCDFLSASTYDANSASFKLPCGFAPESIILPIAQDSDLCKGMFPLHLFRRAPIPQQFAVDVNWYNTQTTAFTGSGIFILWLDITMDPTDP